IALRIAWPCSSTGTNVSRWIARHSAATRLEPTCRETSRSALHSPVHQSSARCSYHDGAGVSSSYVARPSATSFPCRSQAIALHAVVLLSTPITRSCCALKKYPLELTYLNI